MNTRFYDTDVTDAAWAWVGPVLPAARPVGRPRTTNIRAVLNAIFYLLRTGCQWRLLPRDTTFTRITEPLRCLVFRFVRSPPQKSSCDRKRNSIISNK